MHSRKVGFTRRLGAFALDAVFVVFLLALVLRILSLTGWYEDAGYSVAEQLQHSSDAVVGRIGDQAVAWERFMREELDPSARVAISRELEQQLESGSLQPRHLLNPQALFVQLFDTVYDHSPESVRPRLEQLGAVTAEELRQVSLRRFAAEVFAAVSRLLLLPVLIVALYWAAELLFGWSAGKLLTGITVASMDGSPGNIGLYLSRVLFKHSSLLVLIAALLTGRLWLLVPSLALLLLTAIGFLRVLGSQRRALHDVLSGTAIYYRRSL
ncbi:RDD family protein [Spirochaeta africana]|uniref:RDD domain-containing protein n=1 Tax=Spirochaeta africana (strain ATCC 700263 / DSM 8902 / Z-7692) TaxID=889378 RepID=H9UKI8_SPIAZ|nr:RDD family protein [Spirochaeta africana]AFG38031.1 hypothetical protein Spiaf_1980 [Spirochaeta africana DSM 8902]